MNILTTDNQPVPVSEINGGRIIAKKTFADYGIEENQTYKVHNSDAAGPFIFADGEIRLANGEITADVMEFLRWERPVTT